MKRTLLAAALAAAVATPALAQQPQNSQTQPLSPAANPAAQSQPMPHPMGGGMEQGGMGPQQAMGMRQMMGHRMMMRRMMRHRMMAWHNPKEACIDRLARRAGLLAYISAKLNLNPQQQTLWDKIQSSANDEAKQERNLCEQIKPPAQETALDRLSRMEQMDAARLNGLKAAIPEVRQLYQSLSPEQRAILDHPFRD
jgi:hypothetical protein